MHLRIVSPAARTDTLLTALASVPNLCNLVVINGAARDPHGDLVLVDVPSESANHVLAVLRARGADRHGSITIERGATVLSAAASTAEAQAPGHPSEAVVWDEVASRVREGAAFTVSFVIMLVLAMLIAAVGILTDSPILIIGAMVIGPEYGPMIASAFGLFRGDRRSAGRAAIGLAGSFALGIAIVGAFTLVVEIVGGTPAAYVDGQRPLTQFISHPDGWSVVVALLAGLAGTISLTQSRPSALVGVFISVTTIPAAANVGVAGAHGRWDEAGGALWQLLLNIVLIVAAATITFVIETAIGRRLGRVRRPLT